MEGRGLPEAEPAAYRGQMWERSAHKPETEAGRRSTVADPTAHSEGVINPSFVDLITAKE